MNPSASKSLRLPRFILILALVIHVLSFVLMIRQVEPFYTFFYSIAWWSFIGAVASVNQLLASNSLLYQSGGKVFRLLLFSVLSWLFFELLNFRLNNWHYLGVPVGPEIRWPGYLIAFATVFPGLFETERLLRNLGVRARWALQGAGYFARNPGVTFLVGLTGLIATVAAPTIFFPLAWLSLIFLLDPAVVRWNVGESLFEKLDRGDSGMIFRLLLAGLACGILWEFWNFWSGSKWTYTIPYFDFFRIFEMPLLGFLGFPPFALECFLMNACLQNISERLRDRSRLTTMLALLAVPVCIGVVFAGIDRWTVEGFRQVLQ